jgi:hypothetical protein
VIRRLITGRRPLTDHELHVQRTLQASLDADRLELARRRAERESASQALAAEALFRTALEA